MASNLSEERKETKLYIKFLVGLPVSSDNEKIIHYTTIKLVVKIMSLSTLLAFKKSNENHFVSISTGATHTMLGISLSLATLSSVPSAWMAKATRESEQ